ncbi:MAG: hypothetical protein JNM63_02220, partial [Spirochaetia bacterium]|nr:hypothetical protein [Spirochaetia bacterium]
AASTLLFFIGLNIPGGGFHYFFAFFPLAFVPLLAAFDYLKERRPAFARTFLGFSLVNVLVLITVMTAFYRLYYEPLSYRHQTELVRKIVDSSEGRPFRLLTRYEDDTRSGVYQQIGVPLFYEGIARDILHLEWKQSPAAKTIFVLDAYDPAYNLAPIRFWETNAGREIWKSGNLKLFELRR